MNDDCCQKKKIIINEDGLSVCENCGVVQEQTYDNSVKRAYTSEEVATRSTTEKRWRSYGPRTLVNPHITDNLNANTRALYTRLAKIQGSLINSLERNYWEARPKLAALASKLHIPNFVEETAWRIYAEVVKQKLTMGRSIESFIGASLYASVRVHNMPILIDDVINTAFLSIRSTHKSLGLIIRLVFPVLKLTYPPISVKTLVVLFCNNLNTDENIRTHAIVLLQNARKSGINIIGKDPKGYAAGAIYIAAKNTDKKLTQTEIADVARITEVTLRARVKQLTPYVKK